MNGPRSAAPALVATIAILVAACAPGGTARGIPASDVASTTAQTSPETASRAEPWRTLELEDVRTGESFAIADLEGKLVALEPMAIWCSNCRIQQHEVVAALATVDSDDLVYIGVDVDPNERAQDLARYSRREGFDWPFIVASRDLARSLAASFGDQILSPPSTPLILVGPDGAVLDVHFGIRRADELVAVFDEHLAALG